jgi:hypothetical protein
MVMALKSKKLHSDDIQGIRGFTMIYKSIATFAMAYIKNCPKKSIALAYLLLPHPQMFIAFDFLRQL